MAGCATTEASPSPTTPTAGQAIPLLTHTPCYSAATAASHRSEPMNPRTPLRVGIHCHVFPGSASSPSKASPSSTALVLSVRRGQRGQGTTSIGRVLYVDIMTAGSTTTSQFFCDLPSKSLCQACWAANLSRRGELSFGWPRKWPISNEKWVVHF